MGQRRPFLPPVPNHLWRKPLRTEASAGFFSGWAVDGLSLLLLPMIGRQEHLLIGDNTRKALHTAQRGGNSTQISRKSTDLRASDCLWGILLRNCRLQPNYLRRKPLRAEISAGFFSHWAQAASPAAHSPTTSEAPRCTQKFLPDSFQVGPAPPTPKPSTESTSTPTNYYR